MRNILLLLIFTLIEVQAQIIDAIAIDVDGEPITTLEIEAVQTKLNMSKKAAIEALIKDRLEKSAIEKAKITVSAEDIDAKIEQIASARRMSIEKMKQVLTKRGLTWEGYKKQLEMEIKKEKFFAKNIASTISRPTEEELRVYYQTHKDKFSSDTPTTQISLIAYASNSSMKLQEAIQNPMKIVDGVQQKSMLISSRDINPKLFSIINQTPEGSFTKPINTGRGFVAYFIKSKSNQEDVGFEMVKNSVMMAWLQEERIKASKNFLNKLKNNANIRIIRL
jgi:parvulin-like peptidyl-prolyl isomerase